MMALGRAGRFPAQLLPRPGRGAGQLITSRHNPTIKRARGLRRRKQRQRDGLFLVEGIHHVGEAAAAGLVRSLIYSPDLLKSEFAAGLIAAQQAQGIECHATTPEVLATLADKENPQGLVAVAQAPLATLGGLGPANLPLGVAVVAPQDPGNVGAILRTIDAVGASGLILLAASVDPYHPSSVRASMGALFWYPVIQASFSEFCAWAAAGGYRLYGSSAHAAADYRTAGPYERPCLLLLGSERAGLTPEQEAACDLVVGIPMSGRASSLNLAVAAGILLYGMFGPPGPAGGRNSP